MSKRRVTYKSDSGRRYLITYIVDGSRYISVKEERLPDVTAGGILNEKKTGKKYTVKQVAMHGNYYLKGIVSVRGTIDKGFR